MTGHPPQLISGEDTVLVVIDVQEKLLPVIADKEPLLANVIRLAKFAAIAGLPVVVTEQEKLGPTVSDLRAELPASDPIGKITFDCFGEYRFQARLNALGRKTLLLAGIEAHICVAQTALSALDHYTVHVVADAVGSRAPANRQVALDRLRQNGATITSTEMAIYEILRQAGTSEFKAVLPLVK